LSFRDLVSTIPVHFDVNVRVWVRESVVSESVHQVGWGLGPYDAWFLVPILDTLLCPE
jgi:hypothetical protein